MNVTGLKLRIFDNISNRTSFQIFKDGKIHTIGSECQRMVRLLVDIVKMPVFETVYDLFAADRENLVESCKLPEIEGFVL